MDHVLRLRTVALAAFPRVRAAPGGSGVCTAGLSPRVRGWAGEGRGRGPATPRGGCVGKADPPALSRAARTPSRLRAPPRPDSGQRPSPTGGWRPQRTALVARALGFQKHTPRCGKEGAWVGSSPAPRRLEPPPDPAGVLGFTKGSSLDEMFHLPKCSLD